MLFVVGVVGVLVIWLLLASRGGDSTTRTAAPSDGSPPNCFVEDESLEELPGRKGARAGWKKAVQAALSKDGVLPDSTCWCYRQNCSDGEQYFLSRLDAVIGAYTKGGFLRVVSGWLPGENFELKSTDIPFDQIKKIIMRRRTTPPMGHPRRAADGTFPRYDFYYQTRIYTAFEDAPGGAASWTRLLAGRYVFDWLCEKTGADSGCDTQSDPLDGYPEGW
jgi:hypothetical protein